MRYFSFLFLTLVILFILGSYFLPSHIKTERDIEIDAPPALIFKQLNSPRKFAQWDPWSRFDTEMERSFEGPESGVGSRYLWDSESAEVGAGSFEITDSKPHSFVQYRVDFVGKSFGNSSKFELKTLEAKKTLVQWTFETNKTLNPFTRYFNLIVDKGIGASLETGLAKLKNLTEATSISSLWIGEGEYEQHPSRYFLYTQRNSTPEQIEQDKRNTLSQLETQIQEEFSTQEQFIQYTNWTDSLITFNACQIVTDSILYTRKLQTLQGVAYAKTDSLVYSFPFVGEASDLPKAWQAAHKQFSLLNDTLSGFPIELYRKDQILLQFPTKN